MKTDQLLDLYEQALEENLRDWFKEKWVRFGPDGKIRGDCARGDDSEGKPKCLPQKKAHALGKKGRASAARRKRREDPNPERRGKAINVATKKKTNEGLDSLEPFDRGVINYMQDNSWLSAERAYFRMIGLQKKRDTRPSEYEEMIQRYIELYDKYKGQQGLAEEQLDELKCWDGYRRVPGKAPGSPGSCTRATAESMDGVSQGTHMFTSEENSPERRGHVASYGRGGRVGILNKERILKAADFKTRQPDHQQSQAQLYAADGSSPQGIRKDLILSAADTQTISRFIRNFFQNQALNSSHGWLYEFMSEPQRIQGLIQQLNRDPRTLEFVKQVQNPRHIQAFRTALSSIRTVTEKWSAKYKRSINCSNPKGFSQRAHCQGRRKK